MRGMEKEALLSIILGAALLFIIAALIVLPLTKDVAFGLGGDKVERASFTVTPQVTPECGKSGSAFTYDIKLSASQIHLTDKTDIIPALFFKVEFKLPEDGQDVKDGVVPKEKVETGNLPALNYKYTFAKYPPYETESYSLFLFKKDDKCLKAIKNNSWDESAVQNACARHLVLVQSLSSDGCYSDKSEAYQSCMISYTDSHKAVDIPANCSTPVKAFCSGRLGTIGPGLTGDPVFGGTANGGEEGLEITRLKDCELSDRLVYGSIDFSYSGVKDVNKGDIIGTVGKVEAEKSLDCHLHFRVVKGALENGLDSRDTVCNDIERVLNIP